jgi:transcriptional regulator with XRE-family HTH domain
MSFGGHLRALRAEAGLSRAELARRAGVPASTLRHWENDGGFPGPAFLRLTAALGVPPERLAEGVDDPAGEEAEAEAEELTAPLAPPKPAKRPRKPKDS